MRVTRWWCLVTDIYKDMINSKNEFEQIPGASEGQGNLACCSPWVAKSQTQLSDWTINHSIKY